MPGIASRKAEEIRKRLGISYELLISFRFAANVAIASTIVWSILLYMMQSNPIWAIASMIAVSDPAPQESRRFFRSRIINVLVGCASGLVFLIIGGRDLWVLPLALAVTVIISTYVVRIQTMWRQAPITAALIITAGTSFDSTTVGIEHGLHKVAEVVFGCIVGISVSWIMSKVWLIKIPTE